MAGMSSRAKRRARRLCRKRDGRRCQICGGRLDFQIAWPDPKAVTIDHIIPLARGGTNALINLRLAHFECNRARGDDLALRLPELMSTVTPKPTLGGSDQ